MPRSGNSWSAAMATSCSTARRSSRPPGCCGAGPSCCWIVGVTALIVYLRRRSRSRGAGRHRPPFHRRTEARRGAARRRRQEMTPAFLAAAAALLLATLALLLRPYLLRRKGGSALSQRRINIAIYRDQLDELERDRAGGALAEADYATARDEIAAPSARGRRCRRAPTRPPSPMAAARSCRSRWPCRCSPADSTPGSATRRR